MEEDSKIDITKKESLSKWSAELKCTEKDLIHAVLSIGNRVKSVNNFLIVNRKKKNDSN